MCAEYTIYKWHTLLATSTVKKKKVDIEWQLNVKSQIFLIVYLELYPDSWFKKVFGSVTLQVHVKITVKIHSHDLTAIPMTSLNWNRTDFAGLIVNLNYFKTWDSKRDLKVFLKYRQKLRTCMVVCRSGSFFFLFNIKLIKLVCTILSGTEDCPKKRHACKQKKATLWKADKNLSCLWESLQIVKIVMVS